MIILVMVWALIDPNLTGRALTRWATLKSAAYWSGPPRSFSPAMAG